MYLHCLALLVQVLCPVMTTNDEIYTQLHKTRAWAGTLLLKLNLLIFSDVLLAYNQHNWQFINPHANITVQKNGIAHKNSYWNISYLQ